MFKAKYNGNDIGSTKLEYVDSSMGVAFGKYFPSDDFRFVKLDVLARKSDDPLVKYWGGMAILAPDGSNLECNDVVVTEVNLGDEYAYEITVFGIDLKRHANWFQHQIRAHEKSLEGS